MLIGNKLTQFPNGITKIPFVRTNAKRDTADVDGTDHGAVVDTGVTPTYNTKIYLKYKHNVPNTTHSWTVAIGEQQSDDSYNTVQIRNQDRDSCILYVRFFNVQPSALVLDWTKIHEVELTSTYYIVDGTRYTISGVSSSYRGYTTLYIGCVHNNTNARTTGMWRCSDIMIYECKIWESNTLIRDYIPAKIKNRLCLYDLQNKQPYYSITDIDFINEQF